MERREAILQCAHASPRVAHLLLLRGACPDPGVYASQLRAASAHDASCGGAPSALRSRHLSPTSTATGIPASTWTIPVLLHEPVRDRAVTAWHAAINAVMAGCRPEYFRVVGAALSAIGDPCWTASTAVRAFSINPRVRRRPLADLERAGKVEAQFLVSWMDRTSDE